MNENEVPEPVKTKDPKRRNIIIAVSVVAALLICCCLVVVAVLAIDPFGWGLFSRLLGKYDPVAQAMPEDTSMYLGLNLLNATPEKIDRVISPFKDAVKELSGEDVGTSDDLMDQIDQMLNDELDLSLEQDILSWIGQYIGIGFSDFEFDPYGGFGEPTFVIAVEVRNKKAADEFLVKLQDRISESSDADFDTQEYNGVDVFVLDTDYDDERVSLARSGNLLLLSQDEGAIEDAIDAQKKTSLGDDKVYRDLAKDLPGGRALTVFLNGEQLQNFGAASGISGAAALGMGSQLIQAYESVLGMMVSVAITDDGLQLDSVTAYDLDKISETQLTLLKQAGSKGKAVDLFPGDTSIFVKGSNLALIWESYRDFIAASAGGEDYDEMMAELEGEIGFNLETDLIQYLDGEYAVGVFGSSEGMLAASMNVDLGVGALLEVSDEDAIQSVLDDFVSAAEDQGQPIDNISSGGLIMYEAVNEFMGESMVAFGLGNKYLGLATSGDDLETLFSGDTALADNDGFKQVWRAFPGNVEPGFYLDVNALIRVIRSGLQDYQLDEFEEAAPLFEPVQYIAAGGSPLKGNTVHGVLIIFLP